MNGFIDTILDTRAELFRELVYILDDENMMKMVIKEIEEIRAQKAKAEEEPDITKEHLG